jgi:hypothetical protein
VVAFPAKAHFPPKPQELDRATSAGGTSEDRGQGIATTPGGESYVAGFFGGTAIFGAGEPKETMLTAASGSDDVFVAKYARDGALVWATSAGGTDTDAGQAIAITPRGESYVIGFFRGTMTFAAGEPEETTLSAAGSADIFVAKYARDGAFVWATRAGGVSNDFGTSIATDTRGRPYVTGFFQARRSLVRGSPRRPRSPPLASMTCSLRSTARTAPSCGPLARAAPASTRAKPSRPTAVAGLT